MTAQPSSQAEREDVARALYQLSPTIFHDRVDGDCEMSWQEATQRRTSEYRDALRSADTAIAAIHTRPAREHATPRSMPEEVVEALQADGGAR